MDILLLLLGLLASLLIILLGSELFTNGVEWAGQRMRLSEGAVGSLLAAVGTALPETLVPVVAILVHPAEAGAEVGVGAILGAPFMLATLAFFAMGAVVLVAASLGHRPVRIQAHRRVILRDLSFFLPLYALAVGVSFVTEEAVRWLVAAGLVGAYGVYAWFHLREEAGEEASDLAPLHLTRIFPLHPRLRFIGLQVLLGLGTIVAGAHLFVGLVLDLAEQWEFSALVLSLLIAPAATELPEKANSALWLLRSRDTLALGNVTGAMVFQGTIPVTIGILFTPWHLEGLSLLSALLALGAGVWFLGVLMLTTRSGSHTSQSGSLSQVHAGWFLLGGIFYLIFVLQVLGVGSS